MSYLKVIIAVVIAFFSIGCSSLSCLERESTLDKMDVINGDQAQDGNRIARRERMAEKEILNREVQGEKNKGLLVEVVNYGYSTYRGHGVCRIEIRKASVFLQNPVIATLILPPDSVKVLYLMPGFYRVAFAVNDRHWEETYEVTSAPSYDLVSGNETHCTMGNMKKTRRSYLHSRKRYHGYVRGDRY